MVTVLPKAVAIHTLFFPFLPSFFFCVFERMLSPCHMLAWVLIYLYILCYLDLSLCAGLKMSTRNYCCILPRAQASFRIESVLAYMHQRVSTIET